MEIIFRNFSIFHTVLTCLNYTDTMPTILIVDDSESQRYMLAKLLSRQWSYDCVEAAHGQEALQRLHEDKRGAIAAVLLDLEMPVMDGRQALAHILKLRPELPVIMLTATEAVSDVVAVMKLGAADFLAKPPDISLLRTTLEKHLAVRSMRDALERLRRDDEKRTLFSDLVGHEGGLKTTVKLARRAAASDITVMMTGESGTGKEVFARAIHGESARAGKPFVAVNCGALPKDLIESILFGHKKGAFTGAVADALGKFREADGGTLFLDEVAELPHDAQVKLLRAIQQREVEPVGSAKTVPVNIRIIAATNRNPAAEVKRNNFREDLFYRLNVFPIHLPALRERPKDIIALSNHFLQYYALLEKKTISGMTSDARQWLSSHAWAGNVRELENRIYRAVLLCEEDQVTRDNLVGDQEMPLPSAEDQADLSSPSFILHMCEADGTFKSMKQLEREAMHAALSFCNNSILKAAQTLGISKSTFYKKMGTQKKIRV